MFSRHLCKRDSECWLSHMEERATKICGIHLAYSLPVTIQQSWGTNGILSFAGHAWIAYKILGYLYFSTVQITYRGCMHQSASHRGPYSHKPEVIQWSNMFCVFDTNSFDCWATWLLHLCLCHKAGATDVCVPGPSVQRHTAGPEAQNCNTTALLAHSILTAGMLLRRVQALSRARPCPNRASKSNGSFPAAGSVDHQIKPRLCLTCIGTPGRNTLINACNLTMVILPGIPAMAPVQVTYFLSAQQKVAKQYHYVH